MTHREEIGKCIADLRKEKGYTQEQLAELTGLTPQNIGKIEHGKYNTGIDILGNIADALDAQVVLLAKIQNEKQ